MMRHNLRRLFIAAIINFHKRKEEKGKNHPQTTMVVGSRAELLFAIGWIWRE